MHASAAGCRGGRGQVEPYHGSGGIALGSCPLHCQLGCVPLGTLVRERRGVLHLQELRLCLRRELHLLPRHHFCRERLRAGRPAMRGTAACPVSNQQQCLQAMILQRQEQQQPSPVARAPQLPPPPARTPWWPLRPRGRS